MYFSNIGDSELSQYHSLVCNDFKMTLTDVLESDLFKVEEIVSDSIFKVYPLFYCNEIKSNNYDDKVLANKCVICKNATDTVLSFNTVKSIVGDVDFGYSVYNGAVGFVVYCYDTVTNIPLSDIVLSVETSKGTFNVVTGSDGAITYNYDNETLISIKYDETTLYDVSNTSFIDYYGNGLISNQSYGTLIGNDINLLFEDDTIVNYVNKDSLNHNLGNGLHTLIIEGTLTSIGDRAFYRCSGLQSISLPSVTSIGAGAFWGCRGLEVVEFNWTTSETILTYNSNWFTGASSSFIFSIPPNTKALYENKGYPSNRLVERSE